MGRATAADASRNSVRQRFQSTPSVGRATIKHNNILFNRWHFNPRPPWGGRRANLSHSVVLIDISIHALRGEGDDILFNQTVEQGISIHALRGEGDVELPALGHYRNISIHALRGEGDCLFVVTALDRRHFNPRPPWGGRPEYSQLPLERPQFQSTPSVGRATAKIYKYAMLCLYIVHIKLYIFATAVLFT